MNLCDEACRTARMASVVMLRDYGHWNRERTQRMFRRGRTYRVCPHVATTMRCTGAAIEEGETDG